jgi:hypothetical protein
MADIPVPHRIRGKTIRFTWADGPTKGESHEHVFHDDGSVEYARLDGDKPKGAYTKEKRYGAMKVSDEVELVSYLAASGYTLTAALNFRDRSLHAFASNDKQWFACTGTFEVVS